MCVAAAKFGPVSIGTRTDAEWGFFSDDAGVGDQIIMPATAEGGIKWGKVEQVKRERLFSALSLYFFLQCIFLIVAEKKNGRRKKK